MSITCMQCYGATVVDDGKGNLIKCEACDGKGKI